MICVKCGAEVPDYPYCGACGWQQKKPVPQRTKRGNGQGSILKLDNGKYKAVIVLGWYTGEDGKLKRKTRTRTFERKKDAVAALATMRDEPRRPKPMSVEKVYNAWLPTHRAGKSTMACYTAAWKYLSQLAPLPFASIEIDDLQEALDDCPKGKRTKENIKALLGLMYKYAVPRHLTADGLNLAQYLIVDGDGPARRDAFTELELARIRRGCAAIPYAWDVIIMCYTGFRPSEYLALTADSYDPAAQTLTGGAKTAAGKGRVVTLSPKVAPMVAQRAAQGGPICAAPDGSPWTLRDFAEKAFYPALEKCGIDNPMVEVAGGVSRHRLTPHSCRHTFATLLKRVQGAEKDKLELIGHASGEMLRYYQDVGVDDLRKITDAI